MPAGRSARSAAAQPGCLREGARSYAKDSDRYKVANCTHAQPVFYGFPRFAHGKVISVSVLSGCPPSVAVQHSGSGGEDTFWPCSRNWLCDEPAHQVLVRLRPWRFFAEPVPELTRRAAREGPESVQAAQFGKMLVPSLGPHRVVGEDGPPRHVGVRTVPRTRHQAGDALHVRRTEACRHTRTILPATTTTERICADALVDAERRVEARIAERVPPELRRGPRSSARRDGRRPA